MSDPLPGIVNPHLILPIPDGILPGKTEDIVLGMVCLVLAIAISASNLLLLVVLWRLRKRRLTTHLLVQSLAVLDLMVGVFVLPSMLPPLLTHRKVQFSDTFCAVSGVLTSVTVTGSVLMVMCLALDRWIAVRYPVRYPRISSRPRVLLMVSFVWVEAILFSVIPLIPPLGGYRYKETMCTCLKVVGDDKSSVFSVTSYTLCAALPLCVVMVAGVAIVIVLRRRPKLSSQLQRTREACITTLLIVAAYLLCVLPYSFAFAATNKAGGLPPTATPGSSPGSSPGSTPSETYADHKWIIYGLIVTYCNSLFNPVIYVTRSGRMRKELGQVVHTIAELISSKMSKPH